MKVPSLKFEHVATAMVAIATVLVCLRDGSFSKELIAAGSLTIWWALIISLAVRALPRARVSRATVIGAASLLGLAALSLASMLWAFDPGDAFEEACRVSAYAGAFLLAALASGRAGGRNLLIGMGIGLTFVAALALFSRFEPGSIGEQSPESAAIALGRLQYPINYFNGLGAVMAVGFVLLVWIASHAKERHFRAIALGLTPLPITAIYLTSSRGALLATLAGMAVLLALGSCRSTRALNLAAGLIASVPLVLFAEPKQAMLDGLTTSAAESEGLEMMVATVLCCLVLGAVAYALDARARRIVFPRRAVLVALAIAAVAAIGAFIAAGPGDLIDDFVDPDPRVEAGGTFVSGSGSGRYQFWEVAADAFASEPLVGIGAGNYALWWGPHASIPVTIQDAHSLYIETLAELGLVGILLLAAFLVTIILAARDGLSRAATASRLDPEVGRAAMDSSPAHADVLVGGAAIALAIAAAASLDWVWEIPAAILPGLIGAAVVCSSQAALRARNSQGAAEERAPERFGLGVVTLALGWGAICLSVVVFIAQVRLGDSEDAAERGDLPESAQAALDVTKVEPWATEGYIRLGQALAGEGDFAGALDAAEEAADRSESNWRPYFLIAQIESLAGDEAAAAAALARAEDLSPEPLE